MNILDTISRDLDWREAEIASMRILLSSPELTAGQKQGLLRASWALLYAHYEGFCKNTLITFYDVISKSDITCGDLPHPTKLFAVGKTLTKIRNMNDNDLLSEIADFESSRLSVKPTFPDVDTDSNLWPSVLIKLMDTANLNPAIVRKHEIQLKTLVHRRNKIAHGENNIITEVGYFNTYEKAVYDVIYDLALQVEERLSLSPYS